MRPPIGNLTLSRRAKIGLSVVGILIVLIIALLQFAGVYVNWLWYKSVGYRNVYSTIFWTRVVLFFAFGIAMALIIGGNVLIAYLVRPPFRPMSNEQQNIERYRVILEPRRILILVVVSLIALLTAGLSAQGNWSTWQVFLHGTSFGVKDPQFHKDISFYAWDYPAYRSLLGFGFAAIIFAIILSVVVHYLCGSIRVQTPGPKFTLAARRHITILVFVFVLLKAIAYWLDRYGFVFNQRTSFTGASYTDVHAALPARTILFWIALVIAASLIASLWLNSTLLPGAAFVSMLVISILISGIYPAILQSVSVKPNASTKEAPYITRNITATRQAYGIVTGSQVQYTNYDQASANPDTNAVLAPKDPTLSNIRILDPNIVSPNFLKFQQGGSNVYGFAPKLDVDRYTVNGVETDYIVGVRELDVNNLNGTQTNWINEHTNTTHGYGFVAAQASTDITQDSTSTASFAAGNIPQTPKSGPLSLKNPAVYYGELMPDYSIVGAKGAPQEFDGTGTAKVRYAGPGGVSLGSLFTRLAFAVKYKDTNFVLNNAASANGARIIFNRDPRAAVQKVAPFLKVDGDPYPIVDQTTGDVVWMVDGYTTINQYPYSQRKSLSSLTDDSLTESAKTAKQPNDQLNYIRNSVKATVDAYTGKVTLYQWDKSDPVLKTWMSVFPGLVQPKGAMPKDILDHVRYPEDLFKVQRAMLGDYHVDNPVTFYNQANRWTVPSDPTDSSNGNQPPYYVLAASPTNPSAAEFQLTSPLTVNKQTYLASYITVDSDPANYGHITVLQLPKGLSSVPGPEQVYNKITTDATIRKDSLFNAGSAGSSAVIHGNLLTLPLGTSFMYIEPLYTQSNTGTNGAFPVLQRVIVVYGNKTGYGSTLQDALDDFLPGHCEGQSVVGVAIACSASGNSGTSSGSPSTSPTTTPTTAPVTTPTGSGTPTTHLGSVTVQQLNAAYTALTDAYRTGDPTKISTAEANVLTLLSQYLRDNPGVTLPSGSSTPSSSPTK
jgi:uncharacterized membrane protein (UPF0182 family)